MSTLWCITISNTVMCTLYDFLTSKIRFIHTSTVTGSHSCSGKNYAYASRTSCYFRILLWSFQWRSVPHDMTWQHKPPHGTTWLWLWLSFGAGRVVQLILGSREVVTAENWCPIPHFTSHWSGGIVCGILWADGDPGLTVSRVPVYKIGPRAKLESDCADGAWYSTTALPSGRDRSQCLCVLRQSGSEPETR